MPSKTQKHRTTHNKTKKHMKLDDYVIAIPSYKRAHILKEKTLDLLKRQKIPKQKIYIFVANKKEHDEYKKVLPPYYHKIIIGKVGMKNIRNFISGYGIYKYLRSFGKIYFSPSSNYNMVSFINCNFVFNLLCLV